MNESQIRDAIKRQIEVYADEEFEAAKKTMVENLDRDKDKILAAITISIMSHVKFESLGSEIVIRVESEKLKNG